MKQISLLRHGEAPISTKGDIHRELSINGKNDLLKLSEKIRSLNITFDYILCSPIKRAKESMEILLRDLPVTPSIGYTEELYSYNGDNVERFIHFLDEKYQKVLIVGHNPLISRIATSLSSNSRNILFSTSMFMQFDLPINTWHEHQAQNAKESLIITPE